MVKNELEFLSPPLLRKPICRLKVPFCKTAGICLFVVGFLLNSCHNRIEQPKPRFSDSVIFPVPRTEGENILWQLDKSPMDIAYFPPEYPKLKMVGKAASLPVFRVIYSRPQKNGRKIFGDVVKFGEPWRLGANEATEIEFFEPVKIEEVTVPQGRYVLYCIPHPTEWTLIFNKDLYSWGLLIDAGKDVFKFTVPIQSIEPPLEVFTIKTEEDDGKALLWIGWDDTRVVLPVRLITDDKND